MSLPGDTGATAEGGAPGSPGQPPQGVGSPDTPAFAPKLTLAQQLTYGLPQLAIALSGALIGQWLTYFYLPPDEGGGRQPLVSAGVFAGLMLAGRLVDAVADPLIGYWSDRSKSPWGRRLPFIALGTPVLALSFGALWFPPFDAGSVANDVYLGFVLFLYWIFFTVVVAPYFALLPEIAVTSRERMRLSSVMAVFMILGTIAGVAIGPIESALPDGITVVGVHVASGIQLCALAATLLQLVLFFVPLLNIRERPHSSRKEVPAGMLTGLLSAFKNPAFRTFLGLATFVQMGLVMLGVGLPYICTQILERREGEAGLVPPGAGETWVGVLMGIVAIGALVWIPLVNKLVERFGKKRIMVACGVAFFVALSAMAALPLFADPAVLMLVLVAVMSLPAAAAFVLPNPVYADVVDFDEQQTGVRREGIYTGASAVLAKASLGVAGAIVVWILDLFGNSREEPLGLLLIGPVAGVFVLVGTVIFSRHPIRS